MAYSVDQLDTPFVAIDLDIVERNLQRMQEKASKLGLGLRPHTKTHKQPVLARQQLELGAMSITVAKLDEAEAMLASGLDDMLIAYPLVGEAKAHRLALLMKRGLKPTVSIDSHAAMETLALAGRLAEWDVDVLVEVDTGFHRCGITGPQVLELAQAIHNTPGVRLRGLMSYAGHIPGNTDPDVIVRLIQEEDALLAQYVEELRARHLPVDIVSVGGTILSHHMEHIRTATEVRPGIYVYNDIGIVAAGAATIDECAGRVWATVVSQPAPDRLVLDAGSKMLSTDGPIRGAYGHVVEHPDWRIARLSEEHAVVELPDGSAPVTIGERVSIVPNHICTSMNLQSSVVALRQGQVVETRTIMARGGTR